LKTADAATIWQNSKVARQEIYRVLDELYRIGLVEKIVATPMKFRALSLDDGLSILLKQRYDKYIEIKKSAEKISKKLTSAESTTEPFDEGKFIITEKVDALNLRIDKMFTDIHKTIDLHNPWSFIRRTYWRYSDFCVEMAKKGMKLRFLIDKPKDERELQTFFKSDLAQISNFNDTYAVRICSKPIQYGFGIYDGKYLLCQTKPVLSSMNNPTLFSDNTAIIALLQELFDLKWNDSAEVTLSK
jgi:sugar-specific transcriptional regulator TrmB